MKKILLTTIFLMSATWSAFATDVNQWYRGNSTAPLTGTVKINDIDSYSHLY